MKGVRCSWVDMQKIRHALANGERGDQSRLEQMRCVGQSTVSDWQAVCDLLNFLGDENRLSDVSVFQPTHAREIARAIRRQYGRKTEDWPEEVADAIVEWIDRVEAEDLTVTELKELLRKQAQQFASERAAELARQREEQGYEGLPAELLLADPPWQYDFVETESREVENQYTTATVDQIINHAAEPWFPPLAEDCVLFLWATAPKLREAIAVVEGWGFEYRTHAVWDKGKIGMGYWFRGQHELLLVGTRGEPSPPEPELRVSSVFREDRSSRHSEKPNSVYSSLEMMFPGAVKWEVYQRTPRPGWQGAGNETK